MSNKTIVMLTGFAQVGKDTFAKRLVEAHGFTRIAFADPMREALLRLNPWVQLECQVDRLATVINESGWDKAKVKYPDIRALLQRFGTEVGREMFGENFWVDRAIRKIDVAPTDRVVVSDARFENEVRRVQDHFPALYRPLVVKILRPGVKPVNGHKSDAGIPDHWIDRIIWNEGTIEELNLKADGFVSLDLKSA